MKIEKETLTINITFDFDIKGEEQRFKECKSFCKMHRIFCSVTNDPFWDDDNHCIYRMNITLYNTTPSSQTIHLDPKVVKDLEKFLALQQVASNDSEMSPTPQFRFKTTDIHYFDQILQSIIEHVGYPVPIKPLGSFWSSSFSHNHRVYEVVLSKDEMMEIKLKFDKVSDIFGDREQ